MHLDAKMSQDKGSACSAVLEAVQASAASPRAAMLTENQYAQLLLFVEECESACVGGSEPEALRLQRLVNGMLMQGPIRYC